MPFGMYWKVEGYKMIQSSFFVSASFFKESDTLSKENSSQ